MTPNDEEMTDMQQAIDREFDYRTMKARTGLGITAFLVLLLVLAWCALWPSQANAQTAPTFDCTNKAGPAPLATTCTWNVPGATACTAGGAGSVAAWSGSVPTSGTRNLTGIAADMTLTLTCAGPGKAVLRWTPPTTNTDGTTLSNLAGYTALYGVSPTALVSTVLINNPAATTFTIVSLAAGNWSFSLRARSSSGAESANANVVSLAVVGTAYAGSVAIDVTQVPSPPTGLTVTEPTAFEIRPNSTGTLTASRIGLIAVGTRCYSDERKVSTTTYNGVPIELVDMVNWPVSANLREAWAKCAG
jgi:hypothetical protein